MSRFFLPVSGRCSRRRFVRASAAGILAEPLTKTFGPWRRVPQGFPDGTPVVLPDAVRDAGCVTVDPAWVHTLAMAAIDAARAAGAVYADVRLTRTIDEEFYVSWAVTEWSPGPYDNEQLGLGVRALVNGYWGFAGTPYWTVDEAARVATAAVGQAKSNAKGPARPIELGHVPVVTGNWTTPIAIDPLRLSWEEKLDDLRATIVTVRHMLPNWTRLGRELRPGASGAQIVAKCTRQEQVLATTEGSYVSQTLYQSSGNMPLASGGEYMPARGLTLAGRGWELLADANVIAQLPRLLADFELRLAIPEKPVEVGRYEVVCDAATMAGVLDATLGRATEVDRAFGYEANATGTSYLGPDPLTMLGTSVANSMITVTANRSLPTGLATVKWDSDGVAPEDFTLVREGTLVDYQTTREQAAWLAPWYTKAGTPVRSHGCAAAQDATQLTMQMTPNLALAPAAAGTDVEALVTGLTDGIVIEGGETQTDFQCRNGTITVDPLKGQRIYQVKRGKRVARLRDAGVLFTASDFWKNVTTLGGAASVEHLPGREAKGEPSQETTHTVSAVPAALKSATVIDMKRKA